MTDLEPAPESLLKFVQCKCKLSTANSCGRNTCSCCKHGLKYATACGHCRGESCRNAEETVYNNCDNYNISKIHVIATFCFYNHLIFIFTQPIIIVICNAFLTSKFFHLNSDLASLFEQVTSNGLTVNIPKSQSMLLSRRHCCNQLSSLQLLLNGIVIRSQLNIQE